MAAIRIGSGDCARNVTCNVRGSRPSMNGLAPTTCASSCAVRSTTVTRCPVSAPIAERIRARRGANVATVAVARKLVVLFWHMLTNNEEYAFGRPSLTAEKLRRMELTAGSPSVRGKRNGGRVYASREQRLREQQVAVYAETAYRQFVSERRRLTRTT